MKNLIALCCMISLAFCFIIVAQPQENTDTSGGNGMGNMRMNKDGAGCGMMMQMMSGPRAAFATEDGGIIIVTGNKIQKYDKDLKLKKEVEIKADSAAMKKMMQQCPRMKGQGSTGSDTAGAGK